MKKRLFVVIGLALLMTLAGATAVSAWGPGSGPGGGNLLGKGGSGEASTEVIAEALGLTVDELTAQLQDGATLADLAEDAGVSLADLKSAAEAAQQAAVQEAIEQAVTDGDLTREQADWMLEGLEQGYTRRGGFFGRGRLFPFGFGQPSGDQTGLEAAAGALGMTVDELSLQFWGGRTLADLAERADVELTAVQEAIETARVTAMQEAIEQAVEDGDLTREQADWMLEGLESGYLPRGEMMERGGLGGFGGRGGFRGHSRGGFLRQGAPQDSTGDNSGARFQAPVKATGRSA